MRLINNRRGSALVFSVGAVAAAGAIIAVVLSRGSGDLMDALTQKNLQNARERGEKALALGGYFVAVNLVVCREDGWKGLTRKCRWAGELYMSPKVEMATYKLQDASGDETTLKFLAGVEREGASATPVKLSFDLKSNSNIISFTGLVSAKAQPVDKDTFFVFVTAEVEYPNSKGDIKTVTLTSVLRRPMGTPALKMPASPQCSAVCNSSNSENPYGECRGPQAVREADLTAGNINVTNLGPGPLYKITYKKRVTYDPDFFPGKPPQESYVDMLGQNEILMPGSTIQFVDTYPCVQPEVITTSVSDSVGCRGCSGSSSYQITNQHKEDAATVQYDFNLARLPGDLEPAKLARTLSTAVGSVQQDVTEITNVTISYYPTH